MLPPKDYAKWARICEHVVRHYNEGWGWGADNAYTTVNIAWSNQFKVKHLGDCHCELYDRPEGFSSVPLMCKR